MKRLYKIVDAGLCRIGNSENLSPSIDTRVTIAGEEFWLEVKPDLTEINVEEGKTALQVWKESLAQTWANTDTVVIDDSEISTDIRLYDWIDGKLVLNTARVNERESQNKLRSYHIEKARLEEELEKEDYKIIKCFEAQAAGIKMPEDPVTLHKVRQAKRDRINELETLISMSEAMQ